MAEVLVSRLRTPDSRLLNALAFHLQTQYFCNWMSKQKITFEDLGYLNYQAAWDYQESLLQQNIQRKRDVNDWLLAVSNGDTLPYKKTDELGTRINDKPKTRNHLLFVEHPHVYTLGKSGKEEHVLINEDERKEKQVEYIKTNRGGDITYHGPGQLVGYPILDLENYYTDIGKYLRNLEEVIILTMAEYGLKGERSAGETGVWLDPGIKGHERKICALGVRCSRWITMHGFAFNINTDLSYFDYIVPCGIRNKQVSSLEKELGIRIAEEEVKEKVKNNFAIVFDSELIATGTVHLSGVL